MSLERKHLHRFCKVSQTVEERFMLYEVPMNSKQKKIMSIFLTKKLSFWPLMDQNFSKTLVCVSFCSREYEIPSILHPIQSINIVVFFRFGNNCIISKCQNFKDIRHKIKKVQHQYPEFGHKEGEIKENMHKNTLTFKGRVKFSEFHPTFPFFMSAFAVAVVPPPPLLRIPTTPPSLFSLLCLRLHAETCKRTSNKQRDPNWHPSIFK